MKSKQQIEDKIKKADTYYQESLWMQECVLTNTHPNDYGVKFTSFHDIEAAYRQDAKHWEYAADKFLYIANALKWVLKDE